MADNTIELHSMTDGDSSLMNKRPWLYAYGPICLLLAGALATAVSLSACSSVGSGTLEAELTNDPNEERNPTASSGAHQVNADPVEHSGSASVETITTGGPRKTIVFSDLNWTSAQVQNRIAQYIVEKGYGYPTEVVFGSTLPLLQGLRRGDTQVTMEIWVSNQNEAWHQALAAGEVVPVGPSLGSDWQSAFVIPAYLQDQYLVSIFMVIRSATGDFHGHPATPGAR